MRISDWSSDVCSSDLGLQVPLDVLAHLGLSPWCTGERLANDEKAASPWIIHDYPILEYGRIRRKILDKVPCKYMVCTTERNRQESHLWPAVVSTKRSCRKQGMPPSPAGSTPVLMRCPSSRSEERRVGKE